MLKGSLNLVASLLGPDHWDGLSAIDPALQPAAEHHVRAHVPESGPQHLAARNLCQEHKNIESGVTQLLLKSQRNLLVLFYIISVYLITNMFFFINSDLQLFINIVTGTEPDKQEMIWFFLSDLHWMNRNQIDGFL
mgnify:CR=1 FL=1